MRIIVTERLDSCRGFAELFAQIANFSYLRIKSRIVRLWVSDVICRVEQVIEVECQLGYIVSSSSDCVANLLPYLIVFVG